MRLLSLLIAPGSRVFLSLGLLLVGSGLHAQEVRFVSRTYQPEEDWHWPPPNTLSTPKASIDLAVPTTEPPLRELPPGIEETPPSEVCTTEEPECKGWLGTLPVRAMPRLGFSPILPTGPGYYSLTDACRNRFRDDAPKFPYSRTALMPNSFFDADFRYLDSPCNAQFDIFDDLHSCRLHPDWLFATGGEVRWRYHHEVDSQLSGKENNYNLLRTRVFTDLWYRNDLRLFVEFLDAHHFGGELPPGPTDVNRSDLLNAFVDLRICDCGGDPLFVRVGRQEMLFGSQRLISPREWANARLTFDGVRAFRAGKKFGIDAFWMQPVVPDPTHFDRVDSDVNFGGVWATWRPRPDNFFDLYYLFLDNATPAPIFGESSAAAQTLHTLGTRCFGRNEQVLWDVEAMLQLGQRGDRSITAGALTGGAGYNFANLPMNPTFWAYFDYASGDPNPGLNSELNTFNQLFAFGHYYLGWIDLVGRQNIYDCNAHLYLYPTKWVQVWLQYHHFELASARDALYNAAAVPIRRDPSGAAGRNVGNEVDLVLNFHLSRHSNLMVGYSKLFAGGFLDNTGPRMSPEMLFLMYGARW